MQIAKFPRNWADVHARVARDLGWDVQLEIWEEHEVDTFASEP